MSITLIKDPVSRNFKIPVIGFVSPYKGDRLLTGKITQAFLFMSRDRKGKDTPEGSTIKNLLEHSDPRKAVSTLRNTFRSLVDPAPNSDHRKLGMKLFGDIGDKSIMVANNGTLIVAVVDGKTFKEIQSKNKRVSQVDGPTKMAFYINGSDDIRNLMVEEVIETMKELGLEDRLFIKDH